MTPEELLLAAADDIAAHGHCKNTYSPPGEDGRAGPVCAYGAMTRVATDGQTTDYASLHLNDEWWRTKRPLIDQAAALLAQHIGPTAAGYPFGAITRFNDAARTTAEDVILMMKKAAAGE